nr:metallophosphoesterase [Pseudomonas sp.]
MYDIIGDTHGHASRLEALLTKLGYRRQSGVWQHPGRKALFLGDFIDRGPEQLETVQIAKAMMENGQALSVLGNHEFNAVAFVTPDPRLAGGFLRAHTKKNRAQHHTFLEQVGEGSRQHEEIIAWFKTLPVYLELEGLRAVHACWHPAFIDVLGPYLTPEATIRDEAWPILTSRDTTAHEAIETLLKGVQAPLPAGLAFQDKEGRMRHAVRSRWWDRSARTYAELGQLTEDPRHDLPDVPIDASIMPGYDNSRPVFFGHYWLSGTPAPITPTVACLDYSVVRPAPDGKLCAYRWDGETVLDPAHF